MPGYVIEPTREANFIYEDEATLDNIQNKAFVGFRLDAVTGNLTVEIIDDDEYIISLPDDIIIDKDDYKALFWTKKNIGFKWMPEQKPGHLIMEVF
jgi:hypothetical protein